MKSFKLFLLLSQKTELNKVYGTYSDINIKVINSNSSGSVIKVECNSLQVLSLYMLNIANEIEAVFEIEKEAINALDVSDDWGN